MTEDVPPPASFSASSRLKSIGYALRGLSFMLKTQHNAWLHLAATVVVILAASFLQVRLEDWRWLIVAIVMVWGAEAFNTAVEYVCDVVSPGYSEAVKHAKDIAAGAVLVCAFGAAVIGFLTLWPYVELMLDRFHGPVSL
ncbi:diacylglycerol kinase family protein [Asticcacaulis sp.]|uniref:diacylglycerol kinase family protein n=1 Tax=Asticcacaulis sp. TaxID=1872648 RepID=UPI002C53E2D5|nr:diacylglycerol kinase family protein [Asticcacaulis sp.]HTM80479.1 diacylglycerol kinase family protein [Asticcacaulis sp.]